MINVESELFNKVSAKVQEKYPDIFMSGEYIKIPPSFPCATLIEVSNQAYRNTSTTTYTENHALLIYEVNVYSNKSRGKKTEAREIISLIDKNMEKLGFTRIMLNPIPNEDSITIYRIVARYRAVVSKDNMIYRR